MFACTSIIGWVWCGLVPLAAASPQGSLPSEAARAADEHPAAVVFEGLVLEPDGAPAEGAVVVSSAGGKALADRNGRYRLEARVPLGAERVVVTAFGAGSDTSGHVTSTNTALSRSPGLVPVEPLALTFGSAGEPRW